MFFCSSTLADRQCAFKLLYSNHTWSYSGRPDWLPLAPVGKIYLDGFRLVIGMPISSILAVVKRAMHPCTMSNLCSAMMSMNKKELCQCGGWWLMVAKGDGLIIPPLSIVSEFNILDDDKNRTEEERLSTVNQSLSWPALSAYHLSSDFLLSAVDCCQALLDNSCCSAEASQLQSNLQAGGLIAQIFRF